MKILSIGNSFSQDAQRYIHKIAALNGDKFKTVNLYIGGCSLRKHYFNILENAKNYEFQFNGEPTGLHVTVKDALMSDSWDYVTLQQASHYSTKWETYEPYLPKIAEYVRLYSPESKILIHQTWQYDERVLFERKIADTVADMREALKKAYLKAAKLVDADGIITSGELIGALIKNGISTPHRDGYHLSLGAGRLAVGLLWYSYLSKKNPIDLLLPETDLPVTEEEIKIIKSSVAEVLK